MDESAVTMHPHISTDQTPIYTSNTKGSASTIAGTPITCIPPKRLGLRRISVSSSTAAFADMTNVEMAFLTASSKSTSELHVLRILPSGVTWKSTGIEMIEGHI